MSLWQQIYPGKLNGIDPELIPYGGLNVCLLDGLRVTARCASNLMNGAMAQPRALNNRNTQDILGEGIAVSVMPIASVDCRAAAVVSHRDVCALLTRSSTWMRLSLSRRNV